MTADVIRQAVAEKTGIPLAQMNEGERERLVGMADQLKRRVIGQDKACESVAQAVQRARAGLKAPNRPVAVLLFTGPTGTGKTELAKATASFLFDSERAMLRIDMSEFMEKHTVRGSSVRRRATSATMKKGNYPGHCVAPRIASCSWMKLKKLTRMFLTYSSRCLMMAD